MDKDKHHHRRQMVNTEHEMSITLPENRRRRRSRATR